MNRQDASLPGRHAVVTGCEPRNRRSHRRGTGCARRAGLAPRTRRRQLCSTSRTAIGRAEHAAPIVTGCNRRRLGQRARSRRRAEHFGPVHILINNAGQAASAKFTDTDEALWNRMIAVNLNGTYLCTRQAVPDMLQAGFGRIVNVASIAGPARRRVYFGVRQLEARGHRPDALAGVGICDPQHHRECGVPGLYGHGHRQERDCQHHAQDRPQRGRSAGSPGCDQSAAPADRRRAEVAHTVLWLCRPGLGKRNRPEHRAGRRRGDLMEGEDMPRKERAQTGRAARRCRNPRSRRSPRVGAPVAADSFLHQPDREPRPPEPAGELRHDPAALRPDGAARARARRA